MADNALLDLPGVSKQPSTSSLHVGAKSKSVIIQKAGKKKQKLVSKISYAALLCHEAKNGNTLHLKTLFLQGAPKDACDYDKRTPLMLASSEGHLEVVKLLVEEIKVDVNCKDRWGETALDEAMRAGKGETVEYLKSHGAISKLKPHEHEEAAATPRLPTERFSTDKLESETPGSLLDAVVNQDMNAVKALLAKGECNVMAADSSGKTALHHAAHKGNPTLVAVLLKHGADPRAVDLYGDTPQSLAVMYNQVDVLHELQKVTEENSLTTWDCENDPTHFILFNNITANSGISRNLLSEEVDNSARESLQELQSILSKKGIAHASLQDVCSGELFKEEFEDFLARKIQVELAQEDITQREQDDFKEYLVSGMMPSQRVFTATHSVTVKLARKRHGDLVALSYSVEPMTDILTARLQVVTPNGVIMTGCSEFRHKVLILNHVFSHLGLKVLGQVPDPLRLHGGDYVPAGKSLCFFGVGVMTDQASVRWMMTKDFIGHERVAIVRDLFDRSPSALVLDNYFKIIDKNCVLILKSVLGQNNLKRRIVDEWVRVKARRYECVQSGMELGEYLTKELGLELIEVPDELYTPGFGVMNFGMGDLLVQDDRLVSLLKESSAFHGTITKVDTKFTYELFQRSSLMFRRPVAESHIERFRSADLGEPQNFLSFLPMERGPRHSTSCVLMVAPVGFQTNAETFQDNYFMQKTGDSVGEIERKALMEFSALHLALTSRGVRVVLFTSERFHKTPDAVFPNNWFSTHPASELSQSTVVFYPMKTVSRRNERRQNIVSLLQSRYSREISLTQWETADFPHFLESTGVLIMDRINLVAYAALSKRCYAVIAETWAQRTGYKLCLFHSTDEQGRPIYHTNVIMSVGEKFAVVCLESIKDPEEKANLMMVLSSTHDVIDISFKQVLQMCGNCLQLATESGKQILAMSTRAYNGFTEAQRQQILTHVDEIVHSDITTIEDIGGGSVRCMMGELF